MKFVFIIFTLMLSSLAESASALNYSGRLVNPNGSPVSGPVSLRFELLYNSNTSNVLCTKELNSVQLSQGVFHAKLNFTSPECGGSSLTQVLAAVAPGDSVVVRVTDTTPVVDKAYGLQSLDAMPFAMVADHARSLGAMGATTAGQVLRWDGSQWTADTIDEVAAGSIGTPELSDNSVTSAKIVDLTITGADIANGTINETKLNLADGSIAQSKITGLAASFTAKENALGAATSSDYLAGDRAWRNFQNDVRSTFVGMGYAPIVAGGSILSTDSVVSAIAKLDGRISNAEAAQANYVSLAGDTMTGALILSGDPGVALGAATKQYVDAQITAVSAGSSQWDNVAGGINYASGNVGIGAATPTNKLEVSGGRTSLSTTFAAPGALVVRGYNGEPATSGTARTDILRIGQVGGGAALDFGVATTFGRSWIQTHNDVNQSITFDLLLNPLGGNVGIGTSAPAAKLDVGGTIKIAGGSPGVGKVLTSDATGLATWETPSAAGITSLTGDVTGTGPGSTATTIAPGAVTYAKTNFADNDIPQAKVDGLVGALTGKEPALVAGTAAQYLAGDKSWQTLNTTAVPEGTRLYFTEPRVLETTLAGFTADNSQTDVSSADSTLVAFQKLQSSINAILTGSVAFENNTNFGGFRATNLGAPSAAGDATTKAYVDTAIAGVAAGASKWTNVAGGINYSGGNVGIGTANPTTKLFVQDSGTSATPAVTIAANAGTAPVNLRLLPSTSGTTNRTEFQLDDWRFIQSVGGGTVKDFSLNQGGLSRLYINTAGWVGLGTTAPTTQLHVNGSIRIGNGSEACSGGNQFGALRYFSGAIEFCNGTAWTALASAADGTVTSAKIADGSIVDADVAAGAAIAQSKIANLSTDLAGKQPLDAELTALAEIGTNGVLVRTGAGTAATRSIVGTANRLDVSNGDGVAGNPTLDISPTLFPSPLAGDANKFLKSSGANTSSWQALVSGDITSALGFTPINKAGDSMPSGVFDFTTSSVVRVLNPVGVTDVANKQYVDAQISGASNQWSQSSGNVYRPSGNVGIGTVAPTEALHIEGSLLVDAFSAGIQEGIFFREGYTNSGKYNLSILTEDFSNTGISPDSLSINAFDGIRLVTGTNDDTGERLRVTKTGEVGIGVMNPQARLTVTTPPTAKVNTRFLLGASNSDAVDVTSLTGDVYLDHIVSATYTATAPTTINRAVTLKIDGPPAIGANVTAGDPLALWIMNGNSAIGGRLGISTTAPEAPLHVSGSNLQGVLLDRGANDSPNLIFQENTGTTWNVDMSAGNLRFFTEASVGSGGGSTRMLIDGTGNVGVGTVTPAGPLDVFKAGTPFTLDGVTTYETVALLRSDAGKGISTFRMIQLQSLA